MALLFATVSSVSTTQAGVNIKNGNFYISYTDMISPDPGPGQIDGEFEIVRTYNSRATDHGDFGFGWGSEFETYLSADREGGLLAHENGTGALTRFMTSNAPRARESSLAILGLEEVSPFGPRAADVGGQSRRLIRDMDMRTAHYIRAGGSGEVLPRPLPPDWSMRVSRFCGDPNCRTDHGYFAERTATGYRRKAASGVVEEFDAAMRLVLTKKPNGYFVRILRDGEGRIRRFQDVNGYRVDCQTDEDGRIVGLRDSLGRTAEYRYDGSMLVMSRDSADNTYEHEYDDKVNMTRVSYQDGTSLRIEYDAKNFTSKVVSRDGRIVTYEYGSNPENPNQHYWTIARTHDPEGRMTDDNRYEFEIGTGDSGTTYTRRITTELRMRGERKVEEYSPRGLGIVSREVNGKVTRYEHDARYAVISAVLGPDEEVRLDFHPQRRLAVRKSIRDVAMNDERVYEFEYYADSERLLAIRDSDGPETTFEHDPAGRVWKIRREEECIEWTRDRFGAIESGSLNGGEAWSVKADAAATPHGFVIEGEMDDAERQRLEDWLAWLKSTTSLTYCQEIMPMF